MNNLKAILSVIILLGLIYGAYWKYQANRYKGKYDVVYSENQQLAKSLNRSTVMAQQYQQQRELLQSKLNALQEQEQQYLKQLREVSQHEDNQDWANTAVPDAVKRLLNNRL